MRVQTRTCRKHRNSMESYLFGHRPHSHTSLGWTGRHAYRCPRTKPYDFTPSIEELILDELKVLHQDNLALLDHLDKEGHG